MNKQDQEYVNTIASVLKSSKPLNDTDTSAMLQWKFTILSFAKKLQGKIKEFDGVKFLQKSGLGILD